MNKYHKSNLLIVAFIITWILTDHYLIDLKTGTGGLIFLAITGTFVIYLNLKQLKKEQTTA